MTLRIYKTKAFSRAARREKLQDKTLRDSALRAEVGHIDAPLGKFLIKQRIERPHEGRSGGFRAIVVFKSGDLAVFLHIFPKSAQENLNPDELEIFRGVARQFAQLEADVIARLVSTKEWIEIEDDDDQEELS